MECIGGLEIKCLEEQSRKLSRKKYSASKELCWRQSLEVLRSSSSKTLNKMGNKETVKFIGLAVGVGLIVFPDPVTTAAGIVLVLASLGVGN